jgi:pyridoxine 5-phosphate synthase
MIELGVNIDHVATLREARKGSAPDLITAAKLCELAGAHQITVHLRVDRRHIQDADIYALKQVLLLRMNLEMAAEEEIVAIAEDVQPYTVCLVPETREEVTTEGGLDVAGQAGKLKEVVSRMHDKGILVSTFIDPLPAQVEASKEIGANAIEFHTGPYAAAQGATALRELKRLRECAALANRLSLDFHAGHGLSIRNLLPVARIPGLREVNIGHDIVARSVFIGLEGAVREILAILKEASVD